MSSTKRSVNFGEDSPSSVSAAAAPTQVGAAPERAASPVVVPSPTSAAPSSALKSSLKSTAPASTPSGVVVCRANGTTPNATHVHCTDCDKDIPIADWPNHKDRLRSYKMKETTLSFVQSYILRPLLDIFIWCLVNVFFREVAVVGEENIPATGPVVFYGNHQNQFMDAMLMRATCHGRQVRFIIAEKSMHRAVIGQFARLMKCVPVVRPQDVPQVPGQGKFVSVQGVCVKGDAATDFVKEVAPGDVVAWSLPGGKKAQGQIAHIVGQHELTLTLRVDAADEVTTPVAFKFSKRIDQSEMYAEVYGTLSHGDAIGIFPEGGSHDRTSLQPLKAGVALFSLGAKERGIDVTIIPVGLTYFYGHKFRSRAHVEFGKPIKVPENLEELFKTDKRTATGDLLKKLNEELRNVTINVPDWATLKNLHTFRRLYQPSNAVLETGKYLQLTRRLSNILVDHAEESDVSDFRAKAESYNDYCNALLVRDSQAATLYKLADGERVPIRLVLRRVAMLVILGVVLVPFVVLGVPIGAIAHLLSEDHARAAKAGSSIKMVAADVKASYKVIVGFVLIPVMCIAFGAVVLAYSDLRTALAMMLALPMALYVSLHVAREFTLEVRATLPLVMSLLSKHKQFIKLYERRKTVVEMAQAIVAKYDPDLGSLIEIDNSSVDAHVRQPSLFSLRHRSRK